jgi:uncharacterized membrane protein
MAKIKKFVSINAPLDRVYEYVTHPENLPEIWPSMIEVSNVQRKPDGSHSFDWVYKMAGIHFNGHANTIEVEMNKRVVVKNEKGIPSTFYWTYSGENGGTRVTMEVDYTLPGRVLDKLAEPFLHRLNEREAETVLENLKSRMEIGMQPGKAAQQPRR